MKSFFAGFLAAVAFGTWVESVLRRRALEQELSWTWTHDTGGFAFVELDPVTGDQITYVDESSVVWH